jgi:hypothetical protein
MLQNINTSTFTWYALNSTQRSADLEFTVSLDKNFFLDNGKWKYFKSLAIPPITVTLTGAKNLQNLVAEIYAVAEPDVDE